MGGNLLRFLLSQLFKFSKLKKTFIVAEIGVNHEGDFNKALDLIKKADEAGVDAVKFRHIKRNIIFLQLNQREGIEQKDFNCQKNNL